MTGINLLRWHEWLLHLEIGLLGCCLCGYVVKADYLHKCAERRYADIGQAHRHAWRQAGGVDDNHCVLFLLPLPTRHDAFDFYTIILYHNFCILIHVLLCTVRYTERKLHSPRMPATNTAEQYFVTDRQ